MRKRGRPRKYPLEPEVRQSKVCPRVLFLFEEAANRRPKLEPTYGMNSNFAVSEVEMIRLHLAKHKVPELTEVEFNITPDELDKIVRGEIWPYAGGLLQPPEGQGPDLKYQYTNNLSWFSRGVTSIARDYLTDAEFAVYCNMTGQKLSLGRRIVKETEERNDPGKYERFRKILFLTSQGGTIEGAVTKAGKPNGNSGSANRRRSVRRGFGRHHDDPVMYGLPEGGAGELDKLQESSVEGNSE